MRQIQIAISFKVLKHEKPPSLWQVVQAALEEV